MIYVSLYFEDSLIADGDTMFAPYVFSNGSYDPLFHEHMK